MSRARAVYAIIVAVFVICGARLFWLQIVKGPELAKAGEEARVATIEVPARRGDIVDAKGTVLATSQKTYNIFYNRKFIGDYQRTGKPSAKDRKVIPNALARQDEDRAKNHTKSTAPYLLGTGAMAAATQLAPLLHMSAAELGGKMEGAHGAAVLARNVKPDVWERIKALKIPGIDALPAYVRAYPNGATASTVLGFTALAGSGEPGAPLRGVAGIEKTQDAQLKGKNGRRRVEISALGQAIPGGFREGDDGQPGKTVQLTINADLQALAQKQIDEAVGKFGAKWGAVVVEEVSTGRILSLADSGELPPDQMRKQTGVTGSRAVQFAYEPGSVGKLVTFATGLEKKGFTPLTPVRVPYAITMPNGQTFHDSHEHGTQHLTATGVLAQSSNTGTVQLGDHLKDADRWAMMRAFGLGQKTGIEMPAESSGLIANYSKWGPRQRYTTMFGQGIAVSPVQITSMVATIGNGGVRVQPHLIEGWKTALGTGTKKQLPSPKRVFSADAAATLVRMMQSVPVKGGTAPAAAVPGYLTAGKTGTTELLSKTGVHEGVVGSFVGLVPADKPRVAIGVVLYKPSSGTYGGTVAGPTFSQVGAMAMTILDVPGSSAQPKLYPTEAR